MNKQIKTLFYIKQANGELLYVANSNGGPELSADAHAEIVAKVPQALKADIYAVSEGIHKLVWKARIGTKKPVEEVVGDELREAFKVEKNTPTVGVDMRAEALEKLETQIKKNNYRINRQSDQIKELESEVLKCAAFHDEFKIKLRIHEENISNLERKNRSLRRTLAWLMFSVFFFGLALMAKIIWG